MFSAFVLAAAVEGTFTLTDRTETRVRAPDPVTNNTAYDIENVPNARLVLTSPKFEYTFVYAPHLDYIDLNEQGARPSILNTGLAAAQWHERHVRLTLAEAASYGDQSFAGLAFLPAVGATPPPNGAVGGVTATGTTPLPTTQPVPPVELVRIVSTITTLQSQIELHRLVLTQLVGYQISGGADAAAQELLPLLHVGFAEADFDAKADPRDHFVTVLKANAANATSQTFGTAPGENIDSVLVELDERWERQWSRATNTELGVGIYGERLQLAAGAPYTFSADPTFYAALNDRLARGRNQIDFRAEVGLGPTIDRLTGFVDQRAFATAQLTWTHRHFELRLLGTVAETVPQTASGALRVATGEIDAIYHVSKVVTLDGGFRLLWEKQDPILQTATVEGTQALTFGPAAVAFVALTVNAVKSHL
jgi:hypothetical protein